MRDIDLFQLALGLVPVAADFDAEKKRLDIENLMLASSSVFCIRKMWLAFSRFNCLRVRRSVRISGLGHLARSWAGSDRAPIGQKPSRHPSHRFYDPARS